MNSEAGVLRIGIAQKESIGVAGGGEGVDAQLEAILGGQRAIDVDDLGAHAHLVHRRQTIGDGEILRAQNRGFDLRRRRRRQHAPHEPHREVDEHAGRLALVVAQDASAGRIFGRAGDVRLLERERVGPAGVAVDALEPHRPIGDHGVERCVRGKFGVGKTVLIPAVAEEPIAFDAGESVGALVGGGAAAQIDLTGGDAEAVEMRVRVGERGHHRPSGELDDARLLADERLHLGVGAEREDDAVAHRQRRHVRMSRVERHDVAAAQHQRRVTRSRRYRHRAPTKTNNRQAPHARSLLRDRATAAWYPCESEPRSRPDRACRRAPPTPSVTGSRARGRDPPARNRRAR